MSRVPGWVFDESGASKLCTTIEQLESHLANGWADKQFPPAPLEAQGSVTAPPCQGCAEWKAVAKQLDEENAELRSRVSAMIAERHGLPATAEPQAPEGPIPGISELTEALQQSDQDLKDTAAGFGDVPPPPKFDDAPKKSAAKKK